MNYVNLDNLNLESARRAIARARELRPWCTRNSNNRNQYRVVGRQREHGIYDVEFFFSQAGRFAICRDKRHRVCQGIQWGAQNGKICTHIARAYFRHKINLEKEAQRQQQQVAA